MDALNPSLPVAAAMTLDELTTELVRCGVLLSLSDDAKLQVMAPRGALGDVLRAAISKHRDALVTALAATTGNGTAAEATTRIPALRPEGAVFAPAYRA